MTNKLIAHINPQDSAAAECLREHLSLTAEYASKAGDKFNAGYLAYQVVTFCVSAIKCESGGLLSIKRSACRILFHRQATPCHGNSRFQTLRSMFELGS